MNDITAPKNVVKSVTNSDVVSRSEHPTYWNLTDGSRMGSDFNKRTGKNGYLDVKDTSNKSGYMRRSGFIGKSATGGPLPVRVFFCEPYTEGGICGGSSYQYVKI